MKTKIIFLLVSAFAMYAHADYDGDFRLGDRWGNERVQTQTVLCESNGHRYNSCSVSGRILNARIRTQLSHSDCSYGSTWGVESNYVWVNDGCRAYFEVEVRGGWGGGGPHHGNVQRITCSSNGHSYAECPVRGRIYNVTLAQQLSNSPCNQSVSWGYTDSSVWVNDGCRANFDVELW